MGLISVSVRSALQQSGVKAGPAAGQEGRAVSVSLGQFSSYASYDTDTHPFEGVLRQVLRCDDLARLHELLETDALTAEEKAFYTGAPPAFGVNDRKSAFVRWFHEAFDAGTDINEMYLQFALRNVLPLFPGEDGLVLQKTPNLRAHLPNRTSIGYRTSDPSPGVVGLHHDSDLNHLEEELSVVLPITDAFETNTVYYEPRPESGLPHDAYTPMNMAKGTFFVGHLNRCRHYNRVNKTGATRVSLDFRVIPLSKFVDYGQSSLTKRRKFCHGDCYVVARRPALPPPMPSAGLTSFSSYAPYDTAAHGFERVLERVLRCDDLARLHEMLDTDALTAEQKAFYTGALPVFGVNDRKSVFVRWFHEAVDAVAEFTDMYQQFVLHEVIPLFPGEEGLVVQKTPNLRAHLPSSTCIGSLPSDPATGVVGLHHAAEFNHPAEEINVVIPITDAFDTNTVYYEPRPDSGLPPDAYAPMNMTKGTYFLGYLNRCRHYNKVNRTGATRVSLDFRIIPLSKFVDHGKSSPTARRRFSIGDYYVVVRPNTARAST